jgi:hypothetical protein
LQRQEQEQKHHEQRHSYAINDESLDNAYEMTEIICNIATGCDRCSSMIRDALIQRGYSNSNDHKDSRNSPKGDRPLAAADSNGDVDLSNYVRSK